MRVTFGALIRAQVKKVVATLHARTHRRMQRLQKEVTAQRRTIRRLERQLKASTSRVESSTGAAAVSGTEIRAVRKQAGLSRRAFAEHVGVSPGAVYLWESGRSRPRGANAQRLRGVVLGGGRAGLRTPVASAEARVTGAQMRAARQRAGLSRLAFAKRLGVSQGAVYLWESGRSTPRASNAQRLRLLTAGGRAAGTRRARRAARKAIVRRNRRRGAAKAVQTRGRGSRR